GGPLGQLYADRLELIEAYDRSGIYGYHLAEHHSTPLGCAASPGLFLAAMTQRTKTLRFGPLVYLLPFYHPLRLIEEICMLDQMGGGRLELGIGRGVSPFETPSRGSRRFIRRPSTTSRQSTTASPDRRKPFAISSPRRSRRPAAITSSHGWLSAT